MITQTLPSLTAVCEYYSSGSITSHDDIRLAWVTRVLNPGSNLVTLSQTGLEIRMLVQSFLDTRIKALPCAQSPLPSVPVITRNQESQEEYEQLYLELNDAELLAALGEEAVKSVVTGLKAKEDALCKANISGMYFSDYS